MKHRSLKIGFAIFALVLASLACGVSTANISNAYMSFDYEGTQETTVYAQDNTFYCIVEVSNAPDDTLVKTVWTAVQVDDETVTPNLFLDETELTIKDNLSSLHFQLSNDYLWPTGTYKVDIYLNGELDRTINFQVQ